MQTDAAGGRTGGVRGEIRAERYLESKGWRMLAHNYAAGGGEIDLIMLDGAVIVFVEVKVRNGGHMAAREAVTPAKQRRICRAALTYMQRFGHMNRQARFDVVEIQDGHLTHIANAFPYSGPVF